MGPIDVPDALAIEMMSTTCKNSTCNYLYMYLNTWHKNPARAGKHVEV